MEKYAERRVTAGNISADIYIYMDVVRYRRLCTYRASLQVLLLAACAGLQELIADLEQVRAKRVIEAD